VFSFGGIFFLERRRRTVLHYIKKEKRETFPESTQTQLNSTQHTPTHSPSTLRDSNQKLAGDRKDERPKITLRAFKDELQLWHMAGAKGLSALGLGAVTSS
jgi:hypothetical protein